MKNSKLRKLPGTRSGFDSTVVDLGGSTLRFGLFDGDVKESGAEGDRHLFMISKRRFDKVSFTRILPTRTLFA